MGRDRCPLSGAQRRPLDRFSEVCNVLAERYFQSVICPCPLLRRLSASRKVHYERFYCKSFGSVHKEYGMEQEQDFHLCHLQLAVPMISSN